MKQITVKRAVEALYWLHNNAHFEAGAEFHPTKVDDKGRPLATHMFYRNNFEKLRVPAALMTEVSKYIRPNTRPFDTRMFALTRAGKMLVTR